MSSMHPSQYANGVDRYVNFGQDFMGARFAETQKRILRSVNEHQRVLIISGNGVGKSYGVAILALAFLYTNTDSVVLGTSGSYGQFIDTMWGPMKSMAQDLKDDHGLPGQIYSGNKPAIEINSEWFFRVTSPRDPGELEGRHADDVLVIIEEADKEYITPEHFDSAGSSITDMNDKMVAIANPPDDEANVVYEKAQQDRWHVIDFSSFESHNVQVDMGDVADEHIPGLVDLITIADDWEAWNDTDWPETPDDWPGVNHYKQKIQRGDMERSELIEMLRPGAPVARDAHKLEQSLDKKWYKRRLGDIPPAAAVIHRPFTLQDVRDAYERDPEITTPQPQAVGIDVARKGGDYNVVDGVHADVLRVYNRWNGTDHNQNERKIRSILDQWPDPDIAIDASPEGSGLADRLGAEYGGLTRFNAGEKAANSQTYFDKWSEALHAFGSFLDNGGSFSNSILREELLAAARVVETQEKYYSNRNATVYKCTSKDAVKQKLGRSPDMLDAAIQAVWRNRVNPTPNAISSTWYDPA